MASKKIKTVSLRFTREELETLEAALTVFEISRKDTIDLADKYPDSLDMAFYAAKAEDELAASEMLISRVVKELILWQH